MPAGPLRRGQRRWRRRSRQPVNRGLNISAILIEWTTPRLQCPVGSKTIILKTSWPAVIRRGLEAHPRNHLDYMGKQRVQCRSRNSRMSCTLKDPAGASDNGERVFQGRSCLKCGVLCRISITAFLVGKDTSYFFSSILIPLLSIFVSTATLRPNSAMAFSRSFLLRSVITAMVGPTEDIPTKLKPASRI